MFSDFYLTASLVYTNFLACFQILLTLNFSSQIRETDDLDILAFLSIAQKEYRFSLPRNSTYARVVSEVIVL
jgi:hypothetical protein